MNRFNIYSDKTKSRNIFRFDLKLISVCFFLLLRFSTAFAGKYGYGGDLHEPILGRGYDPMNPTEEYDLALYTGNTQDTGTGGVSKLWVYDDEYPDSNSDKSRFLTDMQKLPESYDVSVEWSTKKYDSSQIIQAYCYSGGNLGVFRTLSSQILPDANVVRNDERFEVDVLITFRVLYPRERVPADVLHETQRVLNQAHGSRSPTELVRKFGPEVVVAHKRGMLAVATLSFHSLSFSQVQSLARGINEIQNANHENGQGLVESSSNSLLKLFQDYRHQVASAKLQQFGAINSGQQMAEGYDAALSRDPIRIVNTLRKAALDSEYTICRPIWFSTQSIFQLAGLQNLKLADFDGDLQAQLELLKDQAALVHEERKKHQNAGLEPFLSLAQVQRINDYRNACDTYSMQIYKEKKTLCQARIPGVAAYNPRAFNDAQEAYEASRRLFYETAPLPAALEAGIRPPEVGPNALPPPAASEADVRPPEANPNTPPPPAASETGVRPPEVGPNTPPPPAASEAGVRPPEANPNTSGWYCAIL